MIWYELELWDGQKRLKKAEMDENEQKMNRFLFSFVEIPEWLTEGAHISKN